MAIICHDSFFEYSKASRNTFFKGKYHISLYYLIDLKDTKTSLIV
ncbi:hypothetical protein HMPREF9713_00534 [Myroides odoratimimus CCUG 12700]|nr:hypothetical protein HMPREF9713_00534 [Myroides odoratimimus CCUG 12700]